MKRKIKYINKTKRSYPLKVLTSLNEYESIFQACQWILDNKGIK